jgi:hypothetical protein
MLPPWHSYKNSIVIVVIENGVTNIGNYAFSNYQYSSSSDDSYFYYNLQSVTIPNSVTIIGYYAFYRCKSLSTVVFPESLESMGSYAFGRCAFTTLVIPDNVKTIGSYAFSSCSSLYSVTIGASVSSIWDWAFSSCSSLYSVTIGASVNTIGEGGFYNCYSLTSVSVKRSTPPNLHERCGYSYSSYYSFIGCPIDVATLTVPKGSKAAYQSSEDWKCFGTIVEEP